jgi:N-methylhydantoinase A
MFYTCTVFDRPAWENDHSKMDNLIRVGIDIGGTFTDFVIFHPQTSQIETFKLLSTPNNPANAVLRGLNEIIRRSGELASEPTAHLFSLYVVHGSTVATNALLERKGAVTALVATRGFRDILEIGRQNRPVLYDLSVSPPTPLVPASLRFEVDERVGSEAQVIKPLDPFEVENLVTALRSTQAESIAVCLLFSFLHPDHEQQIGKRLREAGWPVSLSSEILPEFREFERASTTTVNAYVTPILNRYLSSLEDVLLEENAGDLPHISLQVMQSNGGQIGISEARHNGVRCILSGPAGGIVGALRVAEPALLSPSDRQRPVLKDREPIRIITFDMGGTSTDVSLVDGKPQITTESIIGGCPIRVPVLDIHTIGAGGGSIASVDAGGALRVGPQSAGANPGPACYELCPPEESQPTVTDANLVLGRMIPEAFLGGKMHLSPERALSVLSRLGERLGLDAVYAALGVIDVVNAHMERALRLISVERGYDPSGGDGQSPFTLLSFGGAGGLHAADLARRLLIPRLLIPPMASTLSAYGMLAADVVKDYTQTVMLPGVVKNKEIASALAPIIRRGCQEVEREGIPPDRLVIEPSLDMRYAGQSYELSVPWPVDAYDTYSYKDAFHAIHRRVYGYDRLDASMEITNLRVRTTGKIAPPPIPAYPFEGENPASAYLETRPVFLREQTDGEAQWRPIPFYRFEDLRPGNKIFGPAEVIREDTAILLGTGDAGELDQYLNLIVYLD